MIGAIVALAIVVGISALAIYLTIAQERHERKYREPRKRGWRWD